MKNGIELISEERNRQIENEGCTSKNDDLYHNEELAKAAACYATPNTLRSISSKFEPPFLWPWSKMWWKPTPENRIRELQKAGALIAAEIDRLQRIDG